jgi:hypothetical protein
MKSLTRDIQCHFNKVWIQGWDSLPEQVREPVQEQVREPVLEQSWDQAHLQIYEQILEELR